MKATSIGDEQWERRKFITTLTRATGSLLFLSPPLLSGAAGRRDVQAPTVGAIMDLFIKEVQGAPFPATVDSLKSGKRDTVVTGVVTTMFATIDVIRKTIDLGANFIIAHEPSFYNHQDSTDWLSDDDVFRYKWDLLQKNGIAIWRNHDYIHSYRPDGVLSSVIARLDWQQYQSKEFANRLLVPAISLRALIVHLKKRLGIQTLRFIGDANEQCKKILLMPGAAGGRRQIEAIKKEQPDVIIVGEIQEWETAEYIRDARSKGNKIALIVLGHSDSEEPGSDFMARWLKTNIKALKVHHIPSQNPLLSF